MTEETVDNVLGLFDCDLKRRLDAAQAKSKAPTSASTSTSKSTKSKRACVEPDDPNKQYIHMKEFVDLRTVEWIIANKDALFPLPKRIAEKTKFLHFAELARENNGYVPVRYMQTICVPNFGRYTAIGSGSFQGQWRPLRAALAADNYLQVDMVNAHPVIMQTLARLLGINKTPNLDLYVQNREATLAKFTCSRALAKQCMLIAMYGGNGGKRLNIEVPAFLRGYRRELRTLAEKLLVSRPDVVQYVRDDEKGASDYSIMYSTLSYVLSEGERECLFAAMEVLKANQWQVDTMLHDGCLVRKREGHTIDAALLSSLTEAVETKCKIKGMRFELKEFGERLSLTYVDNGDDDE